MNIIIGLLIAALILLSAGRIVWRRLNGRKSSCDACTGGVAESTYRLATGGACELANPRRLFPPPRPPAGMPAPRSGIP